MIKIGSARIFTDDIISYYRPLFGKKNVIEIRTTHDEFSIRLKDEKEALDILDKLDGILSVKDLISS